MTVFEAFGIAMVVAAGARFGWHTAGGAIDLFELPFRAIGKWLGGRW